MLKFKATQLQHGSVHGLTLWKFGSLALMSQLCNSIVSVLCGDSKIFPLAALIL